MNLLTILFTAAALLGVTSCTLEREGGETDKGNTIVLKLPNGLKSKAIEDQVPNNTKALTVVNAEVFLTSAAGNVVERHTINPSDVTAGYKRIEQVSPSVANVLMVANIPTANLATVQALTNANAIKTYAYTIASQNITPAGGGAVPIDNKTLIGDGVLNPLAVNPIPDGHDYKEFDVTLGALTARFEIGTVVAGEGVANVQMVGVWVNNFYADGAKTTVTNHPSSASFWGITPSTGISTTAYGTVTIPAYSPAVYHDAGNSGVTTVSGTQVYAYHVFAGANIPHLILLVKGEYQPGYFDPVTGEKYFLKWYTYTKFLEGAAPGTPIASIVANTIYRVGITGIVINQKDGTDEPELEKFDLGIDVTLTPWTVKNVTPGIS